MAKRSPNTPVLLCAGEALIDMVPRETAEGPAFLPLPGGAVFNTAIAAGRLGVPTAFWYGLSTDLFGDQLRVELVRAGVDIALCRPFDRPTTLAFVTLVEGQARYLFVDENTAGRMVSPADLPEISSSVRALFVGGISLVGEPVGSTMEALAARIAGDGLGRLIMLDPNIRPGFIRDEAAYRARICRLIGLAHVVKVSDEDLVWLMGKRDMDEMVRAVQAMGPHLVLVTQGSRGARAFGASLDVAVPVPTVTVADTVGAGDTFNAAFLAALEQRDALSPTGLAALDADAIEAALIFAARAAAMSVTRVGANPPWRHEMDGTVGA